VRAVVLAAGLGTRLRPLSASLPKPLFPVCGTPILGHTLAALARAGCEAAAVNLHYLGGEIRARFGGSYAGLPLVYSEEPEILGTLGALHPLRDFLRPADLVVLVNGDSLCRWPIGRMIRSHLRARRSRALCPPLATLLLARRADPAAFGGGVGVDRDGRVVSFRAAGPSAGAAAARLVFAGVHILEPAVLERVGPGPSEVVRDLYEPCLAALSGAASPIAAIATDRVWHDLGTPRRYLEGVLDWVSVRGHGSWVSPEAAVDPGAELGRVVVEGGARIGAGARLDRALVLAGAEVGAGCRVTSAIVGPGAALPPGSQLEWRLAMPGACEPSITRLDALPER